MAVPPSESETEPLLRTRSSLEQLQYLDTENNNNSKPNNSATVVATGETLFGACDSPGDGNLRQLFDHTNSNEKRNSKTATINTRNGTMSMPMSMLLLMIFGTISLTLFGATTNLTANNGVGSIAASAAVAEQPTKDTHDATTGVLRHELYYSGPYHLVEQHVGDTFLDHYDFYTGMDSGGSAGYQDYVGQERAEALGMIRIGGGRGNDDDDDGDEYPFVVLSSGSENQSGENPGGRIQSLRLEGKRRFDRGLIVLDVDHVPNGCGVWPAIWTTDESSWPKNGEIDILETFNGRRTATTALHTSERCAMRYAYGDDSDGDERIEHHRKPNRSEWTGHWAPSMPIPEWCSAAGLPLRGAGRTKHDTNNEDDLANDCWIHVPYDWANQGCVVESNTTDSIGRTRNRLGGGIYVMEWDPANGYIRSWVFGRQRTKTSDNNDDGGIETIPTNLRASLKGSLEEGDDADDAISTRPDPSQWGKPYSHFAIGRNSDCSTDHFANHRIVINLAFCGKVSGNLFGKDCPELYAQFSSHNKDEKLRPWMSPKEACEHYLDSDRGRQAVDDDAYWKIRGVYLYQREREENHNGKDSSQ